MHTPAFPHLVAAAALTCGVLTLAPPASGDPGLGIGDQVSAEQAIVDGYLNTQAGCGATAPLTPGSIAWDPPGFTSNIGGSGSFNDPNAPVVDRFRAAYGDDAWNIQFLGLSSCVNAGPDTTGEVA
jgi:hypothetical protein